MQAPGTPSAPAQTFEVVGGHAAPRRVGRPHRDLGAGAGGARGPRDALPRRPRLPAPATACCSCSRSSRTAPLARRLVRLVGLALSAWTSADLRRVEATRARRWPSPRWSSAGPSSGPRSSVRPRPRRGPLLGDRALRGLPDPRDGRRRRAGSRRSCGSPRRATDAGPSVPASFVDPIGDRPRARSSSTPRSRTSPPGSWWPSSTGAGPLQAKRCDVVEVADARAGAVGGRAGHADPGLAARLRRGRPDAAAARARGRSTSSTGASWPATTTFPESRRPRPAAALPAPRGVADPDRGRRRAAATLAEWEVFACAEAAVQEQAADGGRARRPHRRPRRRAAGRPGRPGAGQRQPGARPPRRDRERRARERRRHAGGPAVRARPTRRSRYDLDAAGTPVPSLELRVDGVEWDEVPSLYEAGRRGGLRGSPRRGRRRRRWSSATASRARGCPPAANNVTAAYRVGGGTAGEVDPGAIDTLLGSVRGVKKVAGAGPTTGGADQDDERRPAPARADAGPRVRPGGLDRGPGRPLAWATRASRTRPPGTGSGPAGLRLRRERPAPRVPAHRRRRARGPPPAPRSTAGGLPRRPPRRDRPALRLRRGRDPPWPSRRPSPSTRAGRRSSWRRRRWRRCSIRRAPWPRGTAPLGAAARPLGRLRGPPRRRRAWSACRASTSPARGRARPPGRRAVRADRARRRLGRRAERRRDAASGSRRRGCRPRCGTRRPTCRASRACSTRCSRAVERAAPSCSSRHRPGLGRPLRRELRRLGGAVHRRAARPPGRRRAARGRVRDRAAPAQGHAGRARGLRGGAHRADGARRSRAGR